MGRRALSIRRVVAGAVVVAGLTACASDDDDGTLAPLPIEGVTSTQVRPVAPTIAGAATATGSTTPGGLPIPSAAGAGVTTTTTATPAPTADWDGARFDAGTIDSVSTVGAYTAIDLDRWSFTGPGGDTLDADELDAEPLAAWWTVSPYTNENVRTRTFVLATTVELLALDPADERRACTQQPPADPPTRWTTSSLSSLGPTPEGTIAVLTYSPTGQVTRLRLTRGC